MMVLPAAYLAAMDTAPLEGSRPESGETPEVRRRRLAKQAEMITEARAQVVAGQTVSLEAVEAWIEGLGTDHELPVPQSDL
jgi:hypothetical protein